jgi:hypothetical protein
VSSKAEREEDVIEAHEHKEIAGVFEDAPGASNAVHALLAEHFGESDGLNVVVLNGDQSHAVSIVESFPTYRMSAIGAGVGAVLAALAVLIAGIDFGPFTLTAWGPAWAAFEAAFIGGSIGFALGALMSYESVDPEVDFQFVDLRDAVVRVALTASGARADRARDILVAAGARQLRERVPEATGPHQLPPLAA